MWCINKKEHHMNFQDAGRLSKRSGRRCLLFHSVRDGDTKRKKFGDKFQAEIQDVRLLDRYWPGSMISNTARPPTLPLRKGRLRNGGFIDLFRRIPLPYSRK